MNTRMSRTASLLPLAALVIGGLCAHALAKEPPAKPAGDKDSWTTHTMKEEGFSLALPSDWKPLQINGDRFEAELEKTLKQTPDLKPLADNIRLQVKSGLKFMGFDLASIKTGFTTNVKVVHLKIPSGTTLDQVVEANLAQIKGLPIASNIKNKRVRQDSGDYESLTYNMKMNVGGRENTIALTQMIFVKDTSFYVVTMTTTPDLKDKYAGTFEKIGKSFRAIKPD